MRLLNSIYSNIKEETSLIEVINLTKQYGKHTAVNNLSFSIKKGEILGFLGPNGAGKSTTMNMLTGYLASTSGTIKINGIDILENPIEAKKHIGYLPELPPLYLDMTVKEYLFFVAKLKKVDVKDLSTHIDDILSQISLDAVATRLIKNLSKGYKQRVGLAGALIGSPEVLILDEPTVGLDPKQIIEMRELIKNLSKKHTIILSSHILSEISAVCDRILIIKKGSIVASDTTQNLSHLFDGVNRLTIRIREASSEFMTALKALPGADKIENMGCNEKDSTDLVIESNKDIDLREDVFNLCADLHTPILMMKSTETSLEDIFLQVTAQDVSLEHNTLSESQSGKVTFFSRFKKANKELVDTQSNQSQEDGADHVNHNE